MLVIRKLRYPLYYYSLAAGRFSQCAHCRVDKIVDFTFVNFSEDITGLRNGFLQPVCGVSTVAGTVLVQAKDPGKVCVELENAMDERRLDDTWRLYEQYKHMDSLPRKYMVNKLLTCLAGSLEVEWVEKAYETVDKAFEESRQNQLEKQSLLYTSYALAKCGLAVQASTLLRKLVEMEHYPPVTAWSAILAHMSLTSQGAYLAAELILEIGYLFQDGRVDPRKKINAPLIAMKPTTVSFNIALVGCLLSGTTKKAEQVLDMMPRVDVKVDVNLLIVMANIYERNGRKDELRKLQRHIDDSHNLNDMQFRQFYNCLLNCHLKFGDLDSASTMVLEMLRKSKRAKNSLISATDFFEMNGNDKAASHRQAFSRRSSPKLSDDKEKPKAISSSIVPFEEFSRDHNFSTLEIEAKEILDMMLAKLQAQIELVTTERGVLQPTERTFIKLVKVFLESGKIKELAEFLIKAERVDSPVSADNSILFHVVNSCISLGLLDQAHDLLDEMESAGVKTSSSIYSALLKAYCNANRAGEVASLLRDARKAGIQLDSSCYEAMIQSRVLQKDTQGALHLFKEMKEAKIPRTGHQGFEKLVEGCENGEEAGLMAKLLHEIKDGQNLDCAVHDWNNVIHFFCRKRLMGDAEKALKKMRSLGHSPNAQTFHSMVTGYAAIGGKYTEVTELWGEMKVQDGMKFDQELLDSLLYTFVRGGFFVRANEVVELMEKGNMFVDKYKFRTLFLKYHKTLYKSKPPKVQTEAQFKKREAALTFKKWVGLF